MDSQFRWYYPSSEWFVAVDLGQKQDYTAIVALERIVRVLAERDPVTFAWRTETLYQVRQVERMPLGTSYVDVVERVRAIVTSGPLAGRWELGGGNGGVPRAGGALGSGANDVVNPAAREDESSPLDGMPILDADRAKHVIVLKRGMAAGFAGIENALFHAPATSMLFGDAKASLVKLVSEVKPA